MHPFRDTETLTDEQQALLIAFEIFRQDEEREQMQALLGGKG